MTCLAIVIGVLGIAAMRRAHRRCHGYYGYGWHSPFGHGFYGHGYGRHNAKIRMGLHALFHRIDASPAQERAIIAEVEKLQDRMRNAKSSLHETRGDLAAALRGPVLDDAALGAVLGRVDTATGEARAAVVDALRGVHAVLDDRQRGQIADFIDRGGGWYRGFGPYR
jgi:Spy/CpxP family protein refolding chaperone